MKKLQMFYFGLIRLSIVLTLTFILNQKILAQGENDDWDQTCNQRIWGLMETWSAVKYNFVYFERLPNLNWDEVVRSAIPKVIAAKNWEEYYLVLRELVALLNDGHTFIMPPGAFNGQLDNPPVEFQMIDDKFILVRVGDSEETRNQNLYPGLELIEVGDNIPVTDYFNNNVVKYYTGSTKQSREAFGLFMLLNGPTNTKVKLKLKDMENKVSNVELTRNATSASFSFRIFDYMPLVETKLLSDSILYFKLSTFQLDQLVEEFTTELDKLNLNSVKGVILDVRYNYGGNNSNAYKIISHLISTPVETERWKTRKYLPAYAAWGIPEEWYEGSTTVIEPSDGKKYLGPLVILIGANTFSAAEDFIVPLDYSRRALLVGEKTGGSTGQPLITNLPGGATLYVCSVKNTYPDEREFVGFGIEPDIFIKPSRMDIIEQKDVVLEKSIEVLNNWHKYKNK
ncbi:MAG: S41 family peptidase [bacterium]